MSRTDPEVRTEQNYKTGLDWSLVWAQIFLSLRNQNATFYPEVVTLNGQPLLPGVENNTDRMPLVNVDHEIEESWQVEWEPVATTANSQGIWETAEWLGSGQTSLLEQEIQSMLSEGVAPVESWSEWDQTQNVEYDEQPVQPQVVDMAARVESVRASTVARRTRLNQESFVMGEVDGRENAALTLTNSAGVEVKVTPVFAKVQREETGEVAGAAQVQINPGFASSTNSEDSTSANARGSASVNARGSANPNSREAAEVAAKVGLATFAGLVGLSKVMVASAAAVAVDPLLVEIDLPRELAEQNLDVAGGIDYVNRVFLFAVSQAVTSMANLPVALAITESGYVDHEAFSQSQKVHVELLEAVRSSLVASCRYLVEMIEVTSTPEMNLPIFITPSQLALIWKSAADFYQGIGEIEAQWLGGST